jgi:hypothetical protein
MGQAAATIIPAPRIDASCLTWEGQHFQEKLPLWRSCQAFRPRKSSIASLLKTISPHKIALLSAWLWASQGWWRPHDGIPPDVLIKNINDAWVCTTDMFRLALHNFGWPPCGHLLMLFPPPSSSWYYHTPPDAPNTIHTWAGPRWEWVQCAAAVKVLCTTFGP